MCQNLVAPDHQMLDPMARKPRDTWSSSNGLFNGDMMWSELSIGRETCTQMGGSFFVLKGFLLVFMALMWQDLSHRDLRSLGQMAEAWKGPFKAISIPKTYKRVISSISSCAWTFEALSLAKSISFTQSEMNLHSFHDFLWDFVESSLVAL